MKRDFRNIAKLVKDKRILVGVTQEKLSQLLNYGNAQFVSNIERGICSIPCKRVKDLAVILQCSNQEIIDAMALDYSQYLTRVNGSQNQNIKMTHTQSYPNAF